jgi:hypothetical protein
MSRRHSPDHTEPERVRRVSVFIPAYNEAENPGPCLYPTRLARSLPSAAGGFYFLTVMLAHAVRAGYSYVNIRRVSFDLGG